MADRLIVIIGAGLPILGTEVIDHPGMTAPLDLRSSRVICLRKEPMLPVLDFKILREPKSKD